MPQLEPYHERTRRSGVQPVVYWLTRLVLEPALRILFRIRREGQEHIPGGPVILAANHRSFLDPFVVAACLRRPVYFVAKQELFRNPLQAWFLNCLGAFPIRRGESDEESMETARRGWIIRPVKVRVRCGVPLTFPRVEESSRSLAREVTARIWPCVELQWEWLGGLPALRRAAADEWLESVRSAPGGRAWRAA